MNSGYLPRAHIAVIIALIAVTFMRVPANDFVWDDVPVIVENPLFAGSDRLAEVLTAEDTIKGPGQSTGYYRPLTYLTFHLDSLVWRHNPGGFHLTNVAVHMAVALALYALLVSMVSTALPALLGTLLFALNPVTVEAVCFISGGRNTMLCALFVLVGLIMHRQEKTVAAVVCTLGAAASKEIGFLLPFAFLLHDYVVAGKRRKISQYFLHLVPIALLVIIKLLVAAPGQLIVSGADMARMAILGPELMVRYLGIIVMPVLHQVAYTVGAPGFFPLRLLTTVAACFLLALLFFRQRSNRIGLFGLGWFVLFLLPALFVSAHYKIPMADRHAYLPAIGIILPVTIFLREHQNRRARATFWCIVVVFGILSFTATGVWKNNGTLFQQMIKDAPRAETGYTQLANHYHGQGDLSRALQIIDQGVSAAAIPEPTARFIKVNMLVSRGESLLRKGLDQEAEQLFEKALELDDGFVPALIDLGGVKARRGDSAMAVRLFSRAAELQPENPVPHFNLSEAYRMRGDLNGAKRELSRFHQLGGGQ